MFSQQQKNDPWRYDTLNDMSGLIEDAVNILRSLPEEAQRAAARAIIDFDAAAQELEV